MQTEISRTEVINDKGLPCASGETGQIVSTSLYNFAMPIIRYRFQDLATMGTACNCGRGLPRLLEIIGRKSSLLMSPDSTLYSPPISTRHICNLCGAREWQLDQQAANTFVLRLKLDKLLTQAQQTDLRSYVAPFLHKGSTLTVETTSQFPRSQGGKFYPIVRNFS